VVGAWAGNNDNTPMVKKISALLIAPTWNEFMTKVLSGVPNEPFEKPTKDPNYDSLKPVLRGNWQGGTSYFIDTVTGALATPNTPEQTKKGNYYSKCSHYPSLGKQKRYSWSCTSKPI
jgi:membrane peptidoglycan carboxypeptidase